MKILFCGSRVLTTEIKKLVDAEFELLLKTTEFTVVSGAGTGVDTYVAELCKESEVSIVEYPADWKTHGRSAGSRRNQQMVDVLEAGDVVYAFPSKDSVGTWHTVGLARKKKGVEVRIFT